MADEEERGYEIEALQSIFEEEFSWVNEPMEFEVALTPVVDDEVHVQASLCVKFVDNYPSEAIPVYSVRSLKGLSDTVLGEIKELADKMSTEELGGPVVYNVCEGVKEWLAEHNFAGQDNSMYADMMRKEAAKEAAEKEKNGALKSAKATDETAIALAKEKAVLKARAAGDAVTPEAFAAWKTAFEEEQKAEILKVHKAGGDLSGFDTYMKSLVFESKTKDKLTGRQLFQQKKAGAVEEGDDEGGEEEEEADNTVFRMAAGDYDDDDDDDDSDYVPSD